MIMFWEFLVRREKGMRFENNVGMGWEKRKIGNKGGFLKNELNCGGNRFLIVLEFRDFIFFGGFKKSLKLKRNVFN